MFIRNSCCVFVDMKICTAILLSLCCLVYTVKTEDPWQFWNNFIAQQLPALNGLVKDALPESYGHCRHHDPPQPCICHNDCEDLYHDYRPWLYRVQARWVSGIKSLQLQSVRLESNGRFSLLVDGIVEDLRLRLHVAECLTFNQCINIVDDSENCCGRNRRFTVRLSLSCSPSFPYLQNPSFDKLDIDNLQIRARIGPIDLNVADITSIVRDQFIKNIVPVLTERKVVEVDGEWYTVVEAANLFFRDTLGYGDTFPCQPALLITAPLSTEPVVLQQ